MILYADILFAINFSMDFLSLFLCSIFLHLKVRKLNIILSSVIGAFYAALQMIMKIDGVMLFVSSIAVAIVMVIVAFPQKIVTRIFLQTVVYLFVSCVLGGVMSMLYSLFNRLLASYIENYSYDSAYDTERIWIIISLTAIISVVFSKILTSKKEEKTAEIKVQISNEMFKLVGLTDTGNLLKDPLSGKSVILVSEDCDLGKKISKTEDIYKRYIPYRDVSGKGMLKGVLPSKILINEVQVSAVIATTKTKSFEGYEALIPCALL